VNAIQQLVSKLKRYDAPEKVVADILDITRRAMEAEAEVKQLNKALELACKHLTVRDDGDHCLADEGIECALGPVECNSPLVADVIVCWRDYFLNKAKEGKS